MPVKLTNNATSTLAASINTSVTSISVQSGDAAKFPSLTAGQWFPVTVVDAAGNMEIMRCTARSGAALTVTRAQEGTTAKSFTVGAKVDLRLTAAAMSEFQNAGNLTSGTLPLERGGTGATTASVARENINAQQRDATLDALAAFNADGLLVQTAANTFTARTLTGTANQITITDGDGGSGNPTVSLPDAITLTGKTVTDLTITGENAAPTQGAANNSTRIATTAFVHAAIADASEYTRLAEVGIDGSTAFDYEIDPDAVEICVDLASISLSGNDVVIIQLGTSAGLVTALYDQRLYSSIGTSSAVNVSTSYFATAQGGSTGHRTPNGTMRLRRVGASDTWIASYVDGSNTGEAISSYGGGSIDLPGRITQLRVTVALGANTFDFGRIGVEYRK